LKPRKNPHQRLLAALSPWSILGVATFGGAAVVAGAFEPDYAARWFSWVGAAVVAVTVGWDLRRRLREGTGYRFFAAYEGPILWVVAAWIIMRSGGVYSGHLYIVGAVLLAWLAAVAPRAVTGFAAGAALVLEIGLTITGSQALVALGIHIVLLSLAAIGLRTFGRSQVFREQLDAARAERVHEADVQARARDFGLLTAQAPAIRELPTADDRATVGRATLDYLTESFTLVLDVLRHGMGLTTAAVLWRTPDGLVLRGCSSAREDLADGPYPVGLGIPGSVIDAILIGALLMHNLQPGPLLFVTDPEVPYTIISTHLIANIMMLVVMLISVKWISKLILVPTAYLMPIILMFCLIGAYSLQNQPFDIWVTLAFGVVGFVLEKIKVPLAPFVIGFILAGLAESELRSGLMASAGSIEPLFTRPIAASFLEVSGFMLAGSVVVESVFAIPGAGRLAWESIGRADLPTVQALVLCFSLFYVLLTLLADILNAALDPRMRMK